MRKAIICVAVLLMLAGSGLAYVHFQFHCAGTGNVVMFDDPVYSGQIDGGSLNPGLWWMRVDDTGWPPASNPQARWAYIWTNCYTYDPANQLWTGTFDAAIDLEHIGYGTMHGYCDMSFQLMDWDGDRVLDPDECMNGMSGAVIIINEGTGRYALLCGDGTYEGSFSKVCKPGPDWMNDDVDFNMDLELEECGMGTEQTTWSMVKCLFR